MATYDDAYEFKKEMKALIKEVMESDENYKRCIKARKAIVTTAPSDDTDNKVGVKFPYNDTEMFFPYNSKFTADYFVAGETIVSVWYSYNIDNGVVMENGAWTE